MMAANEEAMAMFGMEMPVLLEVPYTLAESWGWAGGEFLFSDSVSGRGSR